MGIVNTGLDLMYDYARPTHDIRDIRDDLQ